MPEYAAAAQLVNNVYSALHHLPAVLCPSQLVVIGREQLVGVVGKAAT
jgi:hypothetical protein